MSDLTTSRHAIALHLYEQSAQHVRASERLLDSTGTHATQASVGMKALASYCDCKVLSRFCIARISTSKLLSTRTLLEAHSLNSG